MEIQQAHTLYSLHHHHHHGGLPQPLDCSPPEILDLCIRKRCRTPSPEGAREKPLYPDPPTSLVCFSSPGSHTGSETSESSFTTDPYSAYPNSLEGNVIQKAKIPRPFKAYPKDPLTLAMGVATAETILGKNSAEAYVEFRQKMLSQVQNQNQGTNIKMRRMTTPSNPQNSDPSYWEKRRKNNEAAKRSRDARRAKEDEIAIRCAFLEQENLKLKYEVAALRNENERLRTVAYH